MNLSDILLTAAASTLLIALLPVSKDLLMDHFGPKAPLAPPVRNRRMRIVTFRGETPHRGAQCRHRGGQWRSGGKGGGEVAPWNCQGI